MLDGGRGAVKALIVDFTSDRPLTAGGGMHAVPPIARGSDEESVFRAFVGAAERALVAAEDAAGVVPRRAFLGVAGATPAVSYGQATVHRRRPGLPLRPDELAAAVDAATAVALVAATESASVEHARPAPLEVVQTALRRVCLDGRQGRGYDDFKGATGTELSVEIVAGIAAVAEVQRQRRLAEALDLQVVGLVSVPLALAGAQSVAAAGAILIDAGAWTTQVVVARARDATQSAIRVPGRAWHALGATPAGTCETRTQGAIIPLGSAELEDRIAIALGVGVERAQESLRAHAAGALALGRGGASGVAGGREVRRLAAHHAELWAEAVELALAEIAAAGSLPSEVWLCGGGASLPELRPALSRGAWGVTLPFQRPPTVRLLVGAEVTGIEDRTLAFPPLQGVLPLAIAAAARRA